MPQKPFPPPYDILTDLLVKARRKAHINQLELAERLAIGQSAVSKVERGVQRLDMVELHRWLAAIDGPSFVEFASAFDERIQAQTAAAARWPRGTNTLKADVQRKRRAPKQ
jgi:transcriptional regulator with XRE-family HTH domain